jgi:signal transduction histidine kinase
MTIFDLDPDYPREIWDSHFQDLKRQGRSTFESRHRTKDGQLLPVEVSANHVAFGEREFVFSFVRDISERRQAEQARAAAYLEAERAHQMKDEFLSRISHELRTPLHAIIGTSSLLARTKLDPEQQKLQRALESSSNLLLALVNDMLDLSRIEAGHMEIVQARFNPRTVLTTMESTFRAQIDAKQLTLKVQCDEHIPETIRGDGDRLQQILSNLISNAIKYTDQGEIAVSASLVSEQAGQLSINFVVADTGIGIPPTQLASVFDRFHRVDGADSQRRGGTGLGLAIVKQIVELLSGRIEVTSTEGVGSRFSFWLPFGRVDQETGATDPRGEWLVGTTSNRALRALIADDVDMNLLVMDAQIRALWPNAVIETATNGREAVTLAAQIAEPFELVLMDIQMPEMDGYAAAAAIRQLPPPRNAVPIVAISAGVLSSKELAGSGFSGYLPKPFRSGDLFTTVSALIE